MRMKSLLVMPMRAQRSLKEAETPSANCCGGMPAAAAERSIFWPCSSVPVRNQVRVAEQAVAAGDDVGDDRGVGVADVGARVDVIDRRGDVELFGWAGHAGGWCEFSRGRGGRRSVRVRRCAPSRKTNAGIPRLRLRMDNQKVLLGRKRGRSKGDEL